MTKLTDMEIGRMGREELIAMIRSLEKQIEELTPKTSPATRARTVYVFGERLGCRLTKR